MRSLPGRKPRATTLRRLEEKLNFIQSWWSNADISLMRLNTFLLSMPVCARQTNRDA
jgi:hypothetical protein